MNSKKCIAALAAAVIALSILAVPAGAQGRGRGHGDEDHGRGHGNGKKHEDRYSDHDGDIHGWYRDHQNNLPPGLAKRDRLPPGLERQLRVRGTLPPGLRDKIQPVPEEFVQRLPPPPPDCEHAFIGGHLVLLNRKTFLVIDIFHFEH